MSRRITTHAMRRRSIGLLVAGILLGGGIWGAFTAGLLGDIVLPPAPVAQDVVAADSEFVGAERCAECHEREYVRWQRSTHGRAGGAPSPDRILAAFDGQPLVFANARVTPRRREGRYEFLVARTNEPDMVLSVDGVIGGGHMEGGGTQGFVSRHADGTLRFVPFDWSRQGRFWFCNTNSRRSAGWVRITAALPLEACGDWPLVRVLGEVPRFANCQSCHASQVRVTLDRSSHTYATRFTSLAINCEACHGPGRRHVELATQHRLSGGDIGLAALGTLDKDASLEVCWQCHAMKDALRDGFVSGQPLGAYYSIGLTSLGDWPLLADGRTRTFAYQEGHRYSACYVNGGMTCTSCHDPHSQTYRDVEGTPLPGRDDDRQCTSCHPSKLTDPAAHTHHRATGPGGRCVACHMPYLQQRETGAGAAPLGVRYARSDHTISIPRPVEDSALVLRGACQMCHRDLSTQKLEAAAHAWWGASRPRPAGVSAQLAWRDSMPADAAWPLLLGAADARTGAAVRSAGVARWFEFYVQPDQPLPVGAQRRLRALVGDEDPDVRALALASLHLADGAHGATRRVLRGALRRSDRAGDHVRARWRVALGFAADRLVARGDAAGALVAYRRALEVAPDDARISLARAMAWRAAGAVDSAVTALRALSADPNATALTWLNYGLALQDSGELPLAADALARAATLEPWDAVAYFNLGNLAYARGDSSAARTLYTSAAQRDPGLVAAHFQLARLSLIAGDASGALRHLERGLRFDSTNGEAVATARRLRESRRR